MIDICVNWFKSSFNKDREEVLQRALDAGIHRLFITGSDLNSSLQCSELAEQSPNTFSATAGVHPHHASEWDSQTRLAIGELLRKSQTLAVGECGLDFNRNFSTPEEQRLCFQEQVELAQEFQLPLFMHQRDAHESFLEILAPKRNSISNGVIHCFTGIWPEAKDYLDLDLHIGLTGWICDERRGHHMHEFIPKIPLNKLMIETDAPYLIPRDMKPRPSRNEPAFLAHIATSLAKIYKIAPESLIEQVTQTTNDFYQLKD
jgi:TatD DNase family protein